MITAFAAVVRRLASATSTRSDVDADPIGELLDPRGERRVAQRLEAVEQRLDDERLEEHVGDAEQRERAAARDPPAAAVAPGERERAADRDGDEDRGHGQRDGLVAEPRAVALLREPVAAAPVVGHGPEREGERPDREDTAEADEDAPADPPAGHPCCGGGEPAALPRESREHEQLDDGGRNPEPARQAAVVLDALELGRREPVASIHRRKVERGHLRVEQQPRGDRPHDHRPCKRQRLPAPHR